MDKSIRSYLAEFVGTFALVFVGTSVATFTGVADFHHGDAKYLEISFAFGFTLMVLVYTIGPVSGCHVNPAVTLAMALAGRTKWKDLPGYMIAQFVGATAASTVLLLIATGIPGYAQGAQGLGANNLPSLKVGEGPPDAAKSEAADTQKQRLIYSMLVLETLMTALFLFVILSVTKGSVPLVGMAIGGFLFVSHLVGAQLGDSSLNPARSFGPALLDRGEAWSNLWIFMVGPFVGAVVGWLVYKVVNSD